MVSTFLNQKNHFMEQGFPSPWKDVLILIDFLKQKHIVIPSPETAKFTVASSEMLSDSQGGALDTLHQISETQSEGLYCSAHAIDDKPPSSEIYTLLPLESTSQSTSLSFLLSDFKMKLWENVSGAQFTMIHFPEKEHTTWTSWCYNLASVFLAAYIANLSIIKLCH